jgi:hypothetical protein
MSTTRYFDEQVLRKRTYLTIELCRAVIANPIRRDVQPDAASGTGARSPCQTTPQRASCG